MTYFSQDQKSGALDFGAAFRMIRRNWILIALCTALGIAGAVALRTLGTPVYTAVSRLLLAENPVQPFGNDTLFRGLPLNNAPVVESQLQLIRSPLVLERVVDQLNLASDPRLTGSSTAIGTGTAVSIVRDNLRVTRDGLTLVLEIRYSASDPELAAKISNAVGDAYIATRTAQFQEAATGAAEWFDARIAELDNRAAEAETRLSALRDGGTTSVDASSLATVQADLRALISRRLVVRAELAQIETALASGDPDRLITAAVSVDETADPEAAGVTLERRAAELNAELTGIERDLEDIRSRISAMSGSNGTVSGAGQAAPPPTGVELRAAESEARIYRSLYESYFESYLQTTQQQNFPGTDIMVIQRAAPPEFSANPGLSRLGPIGLFLGLVMGLGLAGLREAVDTSVRTPRQLAEAVGAPYLGLVPRYTSADRRRDWRAVQSLKKRMSGPPSSRGGISASKNNLEMFRVLNQPGSVTAQTIRRIAARLRSVSKFQRGTEKSGESAFIVGFVSDAPLRERSVAATNYAEAAALSGKQVLLVDFNWPDRTLTDSIAPGAKNGLAQFIHDPAVDRLGESLLEDDRTGLSFLPTGKWETLTAAAFETRHQVEAFSHLGDYFDQIIVDFGALSRSSDAATLLTEGVVDTVLVVAEFGRTRALSLREVIDHAQMDRLKISGAILTGATPKDLRRYGATP